MLDDNNIEFLHFLYVLKLKLDIEHKICTKNNIHLTNLYSYMTKCDTNIYFSWNKVVYYKKRKNSNCIPPKLSNSQSLSHTAKMTLSSNGESLRNRCTILPIKMWKCSVRVEGVNIISVTPVYWVNHTCSHSLTSHQSWSNSQAV